MTQIGHLYSRVYIYSTVGHSKNQSIKFLNVTQLADIHKIQRM